MLEDAFVLGEVNEFDIKVCRKGLILKLAEDV